MAARCFWDADTDNYAQDVFINVSICNFSRGKLSESVLCVFIEREILITECGLDTLTSRPFVRTKYQDNTENKYQ